MEKPSRIIQITACMTRGQSRDFANVYGLTENGNVAQWDPSTGQWKPFRIEAKRDRGGDSRGGF